MKFLLLMWCFICGAQAQVSVDQVMEIIPAGEFEIDPSLKHRLNPKQFEALAKEYWEVPSAELAALGKAAFPAYREILKRISQEETVGHYKELRFITGVGATFPEIKDLLFEYVDQLPNDRVNANYRVANDEFQAVIGFCQFADSKDLERLFALLEKPRGSVVLNAAQAILRVGSSRDRARLVNWLSTREKGAISFPAGIKAEIPLGGISVQTVTELHKMLRDSSAIPPGVSDNLKANGGDNRTAFWWAFVIILLAVAVACFKRKLR